MSYGTGPMALRSVHSMDGRLDGLLMSKMMDRVYGVLVEMDV